jgi:hypothetical protein
MRNGLREILHRALGRVVGRKSQVRKLREDGCGWPAVLGDRREQRGSAQHIARFRCCTRLTNRVRVGARGRDVLRIIDLVCLGQR